MRALLTLLVVLAVEPAWADGGTLRIQQDAGRLRITAFSAPEPLRVGVADLSVLVQRRAGGDPVLDAEVALRLEGPPGEPPIELRATRAEATNELFYAARAELRAAGIWTLRVNVRSPGETEAVEGELPVGPPPPRLFGLWPYLALPPAAVAIFALRGWLVRRRRPA